MPVCQELIHYNTVAMVLNVIMTGAEIWQIEGILPSYKILWHFYIHTYIIECNTLSNCYLCDVCNDVCMDFLYTLHTFTYYENKAHVPMMPT